MFRPKVRNFIAASAAALMLAGCGSSKTICGTEYGTYGVINKSEERNPNISYKLIVGNIIWSILLVETFVAPIYFIGFSMYEPKGLKADNIPGSKNTTTHCN